MSDQVNLEGCDDDEFIPEEFAIIIFGGGGDLSKKKLLPTLFHLYRRDFLPKKFTVVAAGSPQDADTAKFREIARESIKENGADDYDDAAFEDFQTHLHFQAGRFENDETFGKIKSLFDSVAPRGADGRIKAVYYLSVPPSAFGSIAAQIQKFGMNTGEYDAKIIIEKPFGSNKATSIELNSSIKAVFEENQIYRIDHYLGKETVQNILFFRFANSIYEPLWNTRYIDNVQITVAEDIGIENRGKFYENAGVIRDIIQNHMLQIIALIAMEPPSSFDADRIRDEKVKAIRSMVIFDEEGAKNNTVQGQYGPGNLKGKPAISYREEQFVKPDSVTPTYFAAKFMLNNWRWANVPFYVRAGKRLGKRLTDIVIQFRDPPTKLFGADCQRIEPSTLKLSIQPEEAITLSYGVKYPNTLKKLWPVNMHFSYDEAFRFKSLPAYARLILDCLKGDLTLFVRQDGIEAMWDVVDPILEQWQCQGCMDFPNYTSGSAGPKAASDLLKRDGRHWLTNLEQ